MLALIYLGLACCLGDFLCRRFYRFVSVPHRCATAVLVGLLISSWFTYLAGLAFAGTSESNVEEKFGKDLDALSCFQIKVVSTS
jgi:hypothetical protein